MKIYSNLHSHCNLCDGINSPEEMAAAAVAAGLSDFGFSCHSYVPFDIEYSIRKSSEDADPDREYMDRIKALKQEYRGRLNISCGIEQDYFSRVSETVKYDYRISSVHYIEDRSGTEPLPGALVNEEGSVLYGVDVKRELLMQCRNVCFSGDGLAMAGEYFDTVVKNVIRLKPDIVGHFDVITKTNGGDKVFDENSPEYKRMALDALEKCALAAPEAIFEINTGGMFRGYKNVPYPAPFILSAIKDMNKRVMLSSDCHSIDGITYFFDGAIELIKKIGFKEVTQYKNGEFLSEKLRSI